MRFFQNSNQLQDKNKCINVLAILKTPSARSIDTKQQQQKHTQLEKKRNLAQNPFTDNSRLLNLRFVYLTGDELLKPRRLFSLCVIFFQLNTSLRSKPPFISSLARTYVKLSAFILSIIGHGTYFLHRSEQKTILS